MASEDNQKKMENARRFLWDEDEDNGNNSSFSGQNSISMSNKPFSGRNEYNVDQSVNLMARDGDEGMGIQMASAAYPKKKQSQRRVSPLLQYLMDLCGESRKGCGMVLCVLIVVLFFIVVFHAVHPSDGGDSKATSNSDTLKYTKVQWSSEQEKLAKSIIRKGISTDYDLHNKHSPQYKALQYAIDSQKDGASVPDELIDTRYILSVFHHALNGDDWAFQEPSRWFSETDKYCMWQGVYCVPRAYTGQPGEIPVAPDQNDDISDIAADVPNYDGEELLTRTYDAEEPIIAIELPNFNLQGKQLPKEIFHLPLLGVLDLSRNQIEGSIPDLSAAGQRFSTINLSSNQLSGPLELTTADLTEGIARTLHELYLDDNNLSGKLTKDFLRQIRSVRHLTLNDNKLNGAIPSDIAEVTHLEYLSLHNNALSGSLNGAGIKDWSPALIEIQLQFNSLTGPLPTEIEALTRLEVLRLDHNGMSGSIPSLFAALSRLTELNLQFNEFDSELPEDMHQLSDLKRLLLNDNKITGTIPEHFGQLRDIKMLHLNNNEIHGEIPTTIGLLENLRDFRIQNSNMFGFIPSELGNCFRLQDLFLQNNNGLDGYIPTELADLDELRVLHLEGTSLKGDIPPKFCSGYRDRDLELLTADCQEVKCDCCSKCY